ncbi:MAG: hypothetical protein KJ551_10060 [Alphaproteobacteria bacterium]|nr:hypothetical protein [Alphaproteobacteria bacterium]
MKLDLEIILAAPRAFAAAFIRLDHHFPAIRPGQRNLMAGVDREKAVGRESFALNEMRDAQRAFHPVDTGGAAGQFQQCREAMIHFDKAIVADRIAVGRPVCIKADRPFAGLASGDGRCRFGGDRRGG